MNKRLFPASFPFGMFTPHRTDTSHKKGDGFLHRLRLCKFENLFSRDIRSWVKACSFDDYFDGGFPINGLNMHALDARYF